MLGPASAEDWERQLNELRMPTGIVAAADSNTFEMEERKESVQLGEQYLDRSAAPTINSDANDPMQFGSGTYACVGPSG